MPNIIKSRDILIFCEISKKIGGGHYIRSERLYDHLKKKYKCKFFVNKKKLEIKNIIKDNKNSIVVFDFKKYSKNYYLNFDNNKKFVSNSININPLSLVNDEY